MNKRSFNGPRPGVAAQLMVGAEQEGKFGESGILAALESVLDTLGPRELMLSIHEAQGSLAGKIVETCARYRVPVAVWTMVLADRDPALPALLPVLDAAGRPGYGRLGAWEGLGRGEEKFLFSCPSAVLEDSRGPERAVAQARSLGASGLFLDRIRYPSPANGLEFFGACGCPRCRQAFRTQSGSDWPDLTALAVFHAARGAAGAEAFRQDAGEALIFRSRMVASVAARYAQEARKAGLRVGLDLFAPSLAGLVGQDYGALAAHADFIKPMLYCHARGPAGLPLEFESFLRGLEASGVPGGPALEFTAELTGTEAASLGAVRAGGTFPARTAAAEFARCRRAVETPEGTGPGLYAGIELVDHSDYTTRIDQAACGAYLEALEGQNLAVCWNILYIPAEHIQAVAQTQRIQP